VVACWGVLSGGSAIARHLLTPKRRRTTLLPSTAGETVAARRNALGKALVGDASSSPELLARAL
jgi:hypothetical protein